MGPIPRRDRQRIVPILGFSRIPGALPRLFAADLARRLTLQHKQGALAQGNQPRSRGLFLFARAAPNGLDYRRGAAGEASGGASVGRILM